LADRPLSEREREILAFLLSAPGLPDAEVLRRQAEVAVCSGSCPCGCASIDVTVDPSAAPQAGDCPLVEAFIEDIRAVHEREPLVFWTWKDGGWNRWRRHRRRGHYDPSVVPTNKDFEGYIGLILWVSGGWLEGVEIHSVGNFRSPRTFPPADLFDPPFMRE